MASSILPSNSSHFEKSLADACDFSQAIDDTITGIGLVKFVNSPASFLPFLIDEYGLGELTPYVPNLYDLIDDGITWQRIRGSLAAIQKGLGWIGTSASCKAAGPERNWWNAYQLYLDRLPENDDPDLERIEGIVTLSACLRSDFRRGVCQYDAPAFEGDEAMADETIGDNDSGIIITPAGTVWSFGRTHETAHLLTKAEGQAIGNWQEPVSSPVKWASMPYPWTSTHFPWNSVGENERQNLMAGWFDRRPAYMRFYTAAGTIIGHRRCRAVHAVAGNPGGVFEIDGQRFSPSPAGTQVYVEAMTGFADADGDTVAAVSLIIHALPAGNVPAGRLWLQPGEITGGVEIIRTPVSIPLRKTVREQVKILVRFA